MKFPDFVDLEFSARCDLRCGFCFGPVDDRSSPDLPPSFWEAVLEAIRKRGSKGIVISGGEPTIYPHIHRLVRYARKLNLQTVVSSHGRHTERVLQIAKLVNWIALPVDAFDQSSLNAMRGDSWGIAECSSLARQIRACSSTRIKLGTVATIQNEEEVLKLARHLLDYDSELFDTWKIYEYTPRRKFVAERKFFELPEGRFRFLQQEIEGYGLTKKINCVFSSNQSRRSAYLFVYPDGTAAIPNQGYDFGDITLGNVYQEGTDVFDRLFNIDLFNNSSNFLCTYE